MHASDDLYLGSTIGGPDGLSLFATAAENPTTQAGVGPAGRIFFLNVTPLTLQTNNLRASAAISTTALALSAGTNITAGTAPDGSGAIVYLLDCNRGVSLTSASNLSAINFTMVGYDLYGRKTSSTIAGPNANTVNFPKCVVSVLSVTASTTSANSVSIGTADLFGFPFLIKNAVYLGVPKWDSTLAANAGTFTAGDQTNPATASTGDPRGTYAQAGNPSNGTRQLIVPFTLDASQCGPFLIPTSTIGVTPA
jgi:hypothetical protein